MPATASTLSSDIETSASTMRVSASREVVCAMRNRLPQHSVGCGFNSASRISRYIFQATHSSRTPPAKVRPMTASSCTAKYAKRILRTVAAAMPSAMTRRRHPDDDRIVAGEHHVDDDHRQQRAQLINADQHLRHIITDPLTVEAVFDVESRGFATGDPARGVLRCDLSRHRRPAAILANLACLARAFARRN